MATMDWPAALVPQSSQMVLRKSGVQFTSPFNGTTQSLDFLAERWALSASLAELQTADGGACSAFLNQMAGGVNRVRVWPFATKGMPRGTLRGMPFLGAAAARGDAQVVLSNCQGENLLSNGSFELGTSFLGAGWGEYSAGSASTGTLERVGGTSTTGSFAQRVNCQIGTSSSDAYGVVQSVVDSRVSFGQTLTLAGDVLRDSAGDPDIVLYLEFYGASGYTGFAGASFKPTAGIFQRLQLTADVPAGSSRVVVLFWMTRRASLGFSQFILDSASLRVGTSNAYNTASLLQGDFLGLANGQLLQVQADAIAQPNDQMIVPVVNRVRGAVAAWSPVAWDRPTCEMIMPAMQAGPVFRPGSVQSAAVDLVEVW